MKLKELSKKIGVKLIGNGEIEVKGVKLLEESRPNYVSMHITKKKWLLEYMKKEKNKDIILLSNYYHEGFHCLVTELKGISKKFKEIVKLFDIDESLGIVDENNVYFGENFIRGKDVVIGCNVYIGKNVKIQDNTMIYPNVTIYNNVTIGKNCTIHSGVVIRSNVEIGDNVEIENNAVIGSTGFDRGFRRDNLELTNPLLASIIIKDNVFIGANTIIARDYLKDTVIKEGSKIDGLVYISRGVTVGEYCRVAGQAGIGDEVIVGNEVCIGPQSGLYDYITVGDKSFIVSKSGVLRSVESKQKVVGIPAIEVNKWKRITILERKLPEMYEKINRIYNNKHEVNNERSNCTESKDKIYENIKVNKDEVIIYFDNTLISMDMIKQIISESRMLRDKKYYVKEDENVGLIYVSIKSKESDKEKILKFSKKFVNNVFDLIVEEIRDMNDIEGESNFGDNSKMEEMNNVINKFRNKGKYDCLIGFSGGKDSTYLLYIMKEKYKLNVCAYTFDTGFLSEQAKKNIKNITERLGIDLIYDKKNINIMKRLYSHVIKHPTENKIYPVCKLCSVIYESGALIKATELKIPIVIMGYSPFQSLSDTVIDKEEILKLTFPDFIEDFLKEEEKNMFLGYYIKKNNIVDIPKLIYPFNALGYDYDNIVKTVKKLNLLKEEESNPLNTNCLMNLLIMHYDSKKIGQNPYFFEFKEMINNNSISKDELVSLLIRLSGKEYRDILFEKVKDVLNHLELKESDIKYI